METTTADRRQDGASRRRRNRNLGSSLLFGALAVVLAAIAVFYYLDDDNPDTPPVPQPTPGSNELVHVRDALIAQGLEASLAEQGEGVVTAVRAESLTPPGQVITLDGGATVYAFIYEGVEAQEAEAATLDPATLAITTPSRRPVAGVGSDVPELHVAAGSNVIAVLAGGSPEQIEPFEAGIASLP